MTEKLGSPDRPLKVKCTSVGSPSRDRHYWCIVTENGNQYYFQIGSFQQAMLISGQTASAAAKMADEAAA